MTPVPACTIVSNNYLALARVLAESYAEHHPGARVFVCVVDRPAAGIDHARLPFEVVFADQLDVPGFASMAFRYGILELNTAVKPWFLQRLRERHALERVFYLDPDVLVLDRLAGLEQALERGPMVLTPHLTQPLDDARTPSERLVLMCGVYNLGFLGLRLDGATAPFLSWWQERLRRFCLHDVEHGLFVDQSWIDLAPAFLPDVQIARDAIYNVAYWNLAHRRPALSDGRWRIDGRPLGFVHFSGLALDDLERVSRFQDRIRLSERPELRPLFEEYRRRVLAAGHEGLRGTPYAYGSFDDGTPIPALARRVLQRVDPQARRWADPFRTRQADAYRTWLVEPLELEGGRLNRAALSLWEERADLTGRFPDACGADLEAYAGYLREGGAHQAGIPPEWLDRLGAGAPAGRPARVGRPWRAASGDRPSPVDRIDPARPGASAAWLNEAVGPAHARPVVTRFALHVHALRSDVRRRYPDPLGSDRGAFAYWFAYTGADEAGAHESLVEPVRRSLALRSRAGLWLRATKRGLRAGRLEPARRASEAEPRPPGARPTEGVAAAVVSPVAGAAAAAPGPLVALGVNLAGCFESDTEAGRAARGSREALRLAGVSVAQVALDRDAWLDVARAQFHPPEGTPHGVTLVHVNPQETPAALGRLPAAALAGTIKVGYWFWELAHFPLALADRFALLDEVWAPSGFCEQSFRGLASVPVRRVPPCVPLPEPASGARRSLGRDPERFRFRSSLDARDVPERSNAAGLIEAFARLHARARRPLEMRLEVEGAGGQPGLVDALRERAGRLPITIEARPPASAVAAAPEAGDAYVSLHRAEGLGLRLIEAAYLGEPVIATGYGGPTDWLDSATGWPVPFRLVALARDHPPYPSGACWAEPDLDAAAAAMARVVDEPDEAARRATAARARVMAAYAPTAAAPRYLAELRRLLSTGGA